MVWALPRLTVVLASGVHCEMLQVEAAGKQTTTFPHQAKLNYNYVVGKQPGLRCSCLFIDLFMDKFKLNIFLLLLQSEVPTM